MRIMQFQRIVLKLMQQSALQVLLQKQPVVLMLFQFLPKHSNYFRQAKHHQAAQVAANMFYLLIAITNGYLTHVTLTQVRQLNTRMNLHQIHQTIFFMMAIV